MIHLRTLGALDLRDSDGAELRAVLAQPRRMALLAYLALAGRSGPHQRDELLALLWPERDEDSARNALNQALHFLRRHLGADTFVSRSATEVDVSPQHLWCDAVAFQAALAAGEHAEALALYRGDVFEGFHIGAAPEFEQWLERERARIAGLYVGAMEHVAVESDTTGGFEDAVVRWRQLAARDPLSSRIALRLMHSLAASGDSAAAIRHARVHETLLRDEVGAEVPPEISALVRELQSIPRNTERARAGAAQRALVPASRVMAGATTIELIDVVGVHEPVPQSPKGSDSTGEVPRATAVISRRRWRRPAALAAGGLMSVLLIQSGARSSESDADHLRALYARGQQAEMSRSLVGLQTARAAYELALQYDSTYALAYAGLSAVHYFMGDYGYAPVGPSLDSARRMALRAVALDTTLPEVRTARAVTLATSLDFDAAEHEFTRAIELGPDNARAHYWYAVMLVALGRGQEALAEATRAQQLDRLPPRGLTAMKRYALWLVTGKRPHLDSAVTTRRPILKVEPGEPWARSREAAELAEEGRCDEARTQIAQAQRLVNENNFRMLPPVIEVHWHCGERERAREMLAAMKQLPGVEENGYRLALVHILFGEHDAAFWWLRRQRWTVGELSGLSADQALDPVRADPRFPELLRELGIR